MPLEQLGLAQVGQKAGTRDLHHVECTHTPLKLAVTFCRSTPSLLDAFRLEAGAVGGSVSAGCRLANCMPLCVALQIFVQILGHACVTLPQDNELLGVLHCRPTPSITYQHIAEDATMSMGIFRVPKGKQLPLHNHPGMTVLSR